MIMQSIGFCWLFMLKNYFKCLEKSGRQFDFPDFSGEMSPLKCLVLSRIFSSIAVLSAKNGRRVAQIPPKRLKTMFLQHVDFQQYGNMNFVRLFRKWIG